MKPQPGAPAPTRWYREKNLETEIVCDQARRMGVVDEEYVEKAFDPAAVVGQKITISSAEVSSLIFIVERLGKSLYDGY